MARGTEISAYWRPEGIEGVELFEARFRHHTYARHSHPSYAIGAVEVGAQAFWCGGGERVVAGGGLVTIDPGRVHDGHAADAAGVRYRMLYIEPVAYGAILRAIAPGAGGPPYFPEPTATDRDLAPAFLAMHRRMSAAPGGEPCAMARETGIFQFLAALAMRHARRAPHPTPVAADGARCRARELHSPERRRERGASCADATRAGVTGRRLARRRADPVPSWPLPARGMSSAPTKDSERERSSSFAKSTWRLPAEPPLRMRSSDPARAASMAKP